MFVRHVRIPGPVPYSKVAALQDSLVSRFLAYKARTSGGDYPPDPTVITVEFEPVYTCGRRELGSVSLEQQAFLRAGGKAEFHEALRGGQTTFHGPGQSVAYPIIDLKRHQLTPRSYVCLLEKSLRRTCTHFGVATITTEHPGVWIDEDCKIAALGIHLRRNISSHGVGLNVNTDLAWFDRIVACGLEGKTTTSLEAQGVNTSASLAGDVFVNEFSKGLHGTTGSVVEDLSLD